MSKQDVHDKSDDIFRKLCTIDIVKFKNVLIYSDFKNEVKTDRVINFLLENNVSVYLPVCNCDEHTFFPMRINGLDFEVKYNKYGIAEPACGENVNSQIDCAIIPGIAFDKNCRRIGFGGGYYDRFLKEKNIYKIGICYDFQIVDKVECDEFDIPMDIVISDKRIFTK